MAEGGITTDQRSVPAKVAVSQTSWRPVRGARFNRLIIYPKDIQCITGKSERHGRMVLRKVRAHFKKADHQLVTVEEYCEYAGLQMETVQAFLS